MHNVQCTERDINWLMDILHTKTRWRMDNGHEQRYTQRHCIRKKIDKINRQAKLSFPFTLDSWYKGEFIFEKITLKLLITVWWITKRIYKKTIYILRRNVRIFKNRGIKLRVIFEEIKKTVQQKNPVFRLMNSYYNITRQT